MKSNQSGNLHIYISVTVAGVFLLLITIVICITVYKVMHKERHLPAANTVELSQNESYGLATIGNVEYNATINRSEEVDEQPEHIYEQI